MVREKAFKEDPPKTILADPDSLETRKIIELMDGGNSRALVIPFEARFELCQGV